MKKVSIVYNQSLKLIQGINYVNNSFVMGGKYFKEHQLELSRIYAPDGIFDCVGKDYLTEIGSNVGSAAYLRERTLREFLRELLSSKYLFGAFVKLYMNHIRNGKRVIRNFKKANDDSDYLIFQDMESIYQYYKNGLKDEKTKIILILHCSNHHLEQMMPDFTGFFKYEYLKQKYFDRCDKAMEYADKVIYLSKHAVESSQLPASKKTYIFNGIEDLEDVSVEGTHSPLQLVSVGSVTSRKGQHLLIESIGLLSKEKQKQIHLTLVGGGTEYELCKNLIEKYNLYEIVTLTGPRNDVADILKGMDVFILPSKSEGMPMSIIEAMRQGLYIMSTETGGIPEMITAEYGELVTRDTKDLSDAILRLIEQKRVTIESKRASRKRFEDDFTLSKMIERYSEVLQSL